MNLWFLMLQFYLYKLISGSLRAGSQRVKAFVGLLHLAQFSRKKLSRL